MTARAIAIVEDDSIIALDLQCICQDLGYQVLGTAATAIERFSDTPPAISDYGYAVGRRIGRRGWSRVFESVNLTSSSSSSRPR
jgi:hypothetical protein